MGSLATLTDKTLQPSRIDYDTFRGVLVEFRSPARGAAQSIYDQLVAGGVDATFALAQFLAESNYGTRGFAATTKSWANILWDAAWTPTRPKTTFQVGSATYTYATYASFEESISDYVAYLQRYATTTDRRYGDSSVIDGACARWVGNALASEDHKRYVSTVINAMNRYIVVPGTFYETRDLMIYAGKAQVDSKARYPIANGTALYRGTDGSLLKYFNGTAGLAKFFGPVNQPWSDATWAWGMVRIGTSSADPEGTLCYVKNPAKSKVTFV